MFVGFINIVFVFFFDIILCLFCFVNSMVVCGLCSYTWSTYEKREIYFERRTSTLKMCHYVLCFVSVQLALL